MDQNTRNITRPTHLSAVSSITLEHVDRLDGPLEDGWVNLIQQGPQQPGGLSFYSLRGVRQFDQEAALAVGGLLGGEDAALVKHLLRGLGAHTQALQAVPGKRTNTSQVLLALPDSKLIIRRTREISWQQDLSFQARRQLLGLVARSRACLLGNLPVELTAELIDFGRRLGTFMALVAGGDQLNRLAELGPDALFVNLAEARWATAMPVGAPEVVFNRLVELARSAGVVVMTGGASRPTFVFVRGGSQRWALEPVQLASPSSEEGQPNPLGAGDVLAGVATFLMGIPGKSLSGELVVEAVNFAREAALAHVSGNSWLKRRLRTRYPQVRQLFEPRDEEVGPRAAEEAA